MTKRTKTPKLPQIWVRFEETGWPTAVGCVKDVYKGNDLHRYAPVEKPKVCRWTKVSGSMLSDTGCGYSIIAWDVYKFCPFCGGKIKIGGSR